MLQVYFCSVWLYWQFFSPGATNQCGFVFYSPLAGLKPPRIRGFLITHNDAPHSVGLLWTSDQSVAETSTLQLITDKYPWPPVGFDPTISAGERP